MENLFAFDIQSSSQAESSVEAEGSPSLEEAESHDSGDASTSKDILEPEENASNVELQSKAIEINSADEVRQAVKEMLRRKVSLIQGDGTDPDTQPADIEQEDLQDNKTQEYRPESGDQLHVPKQDNVRKRRGRPQEAGSSKRVKRVKTVTVEDFYTGKLSNYVRFPNSNRGILSHDSDSDSDASYTPFVPKGPSAHHWRIRLCPRR